MKNVTFLLSPYYEKKSIENFLNCFVKDFKDSKIIIIINKSIGKNLHSAKKYSACVLHEIKQSKSHVIKK